MRSRHATLLVLILGAFLAPEPAHADAIVSLTFNQPAQSAQQGGLLTFSGVLSVTGDPDTIFLSGDSIATSPGFGLVGFDDPSPELLMLDDLPFFLNFPSEIASGSPDNPWSFDFFSVSVGPQALPGTYLGTFSILGGAFPGAQDILTSANFQIDVAASSPTPLPAPGTLVLFSIGLIGIVALRSTNRGRASRNQRGS